MMNQQGIINPQLPSGLQSSALVFWFTLTAVSFFFFWAAAVLCEKALKSNCRPTLPAQQTDTVNDQLVNTVEHLATQEQDISLRI